MRLKNDPAEVTMTGAATAALAGLCILLTASGAPAAVGVSARPGLPPARLWIQAEGCDDSAAVRNLLTAAGFGDLLETGELEPVSCSDRGGSLTVRYRQTVAGVPVVGGGVTVKVQRRSGVVSIFSSLAPRLTPANRMRISREDARAAALARVPHHGLRGAVSVADAALPFRGELRFCRRVLLPVSDPPGDWEVFVDGADGGVLLAEDRLQHLDAAGLAFIPDPVTALEDSTLRDDDDAAESVPEEAYSEVDLPDIGVDDDSSYVLTGPWADTSPTQERARMEEPVFRFNRADDRFEEVMVYYHLDREARYITGLGFDDLPPAPQRVNVNGIDEDASYFSPQTGVITTGSGGVDDAEDADVILHEYGHALLQRILPDWRGGDSPLLTEGLCDYLAGDYSLAVNPDFQPFRLFNWDGNGQFWEGRILNAQYDYDEASGMERHQGGQMWSALLTEIRLQADDRDGWNRVVLDHLDALGDSATAPDAARSLLESDRNLANGVFRALIVRNCERRGILPRGEFGPAISHTPLRDTEDTTAVRTVAAVITGPLPLDRERLLLIYRLDDGEPDTAAFEAAENDTTFAATLPAPGGEAIVAYYIYAEDTSGVFAIDPPGAPLQQHTFLAGPDRVPPVITAVDSLYDTVFPRGEVRMAARVSDNIGVAAVAVQWSCPAAGNGGVAALHPDRNDSTLFVGRLRWEASVEDVIYYLVTASDVAAAGNSSVSRRRYFSVTHEAVVADFESVCRRWLLSGWERSGEAPLNGDWCLRDRTTNPAQPPREAVALPDEEWDLSQFDRARLLFWEIHAFDPGAAESGFLEVSNDGGDSWERLLSVQGIQHGWAQREVDLSDYCFGRSDPIMVRWRSFTPRNADPAAGWRLDDIVLSAGNIVAAEAGVNGGDGDDFRLSVNPIPANGEFRVTYQLPAAGRLTLYDLRGQALQRRTLARGAGSVTMAASTLPSGVYLLRLDAGGEVKAVKGVLLK